MTCILGLELVDFENILIVQKKKTEYTLRKDKKKNRPPKKKKQTQGPFRLHSTDEQSKCSFNNQIQDNANFTQAKG